MGKRKLSLAKRKARMGMLYIAPWFIGFLCFGVFPIIYSFYMSLTRWDILGEPKYIGFKNYIELFADDPVFILALKNTFLYMFFSIFFGIGISVLIAAILAERIKGNQIFRGIFYLPYLIIPVAFGFMMRPIFGSQNYGLLNVCLSIFNIPQFSWLEDPSVAIWTVIIASFWYIGGSMIIFLAAIKGLSRSYYEAAAIDGAGWFKRFIHITIPLISPVIFFQIVMGLIGGLQLLDIPATFANMGNSTHATMGRNNALATLLFYLYFKGFRFWEMGAASAIGWIIFLIGLLLTLLIIRLLYRSSSYTADQVE